MQFKMELYEGNIDFKFQIMENGFKFQDAIDVTKTVRNLQPRVRFSLFSRDLIENSDIFTYRILRQYRAIRCVPLNITSLLVIL